MNPNADTVAFWKRHGVRVDHVLCIYYWGSCCGLDNRGGFSWKVIGASGNSWTRWWTPEPEGGNPLSLVNLRVSRGLGFGRRWSKNFYVGVWWDHRTRLSVKTFPHQMRNIYANILCVKTFHTNNMILLEEFSKEHFLTKLVFLDLNNQFWPINHCFWQQVCL